MYITGIDMKPSKGFTLIEMLVAMTVFSILVILVGTVFVHMLNLQRKAVNIQQTEENATFVLESMIKELRVSVIAPEVTDSNCPTSIDTTLSITNQDGDAVRYYLEDGYVVRELNGIKYTISSNVVTFQYLGFCISGALTGDGKQSRITLLAKVKNTSSDQQSAFDIQVSISPRYLND